MKRLTDLILASLALILLSPVMAVVALLVRLNMGRGVLFRQARPGLQGQPFEIIKFRTMKNTLDKDGQPLPDSQRLTRLGRFLRSSSLDELPELVNVLKGEMSLVGPRPLLMQYIERYSPRQARRHEVKPGLTGWAQVNGRNALTWEKRFELDVWYVDNHNLLLDLKIMVMTVAKVFSREGISQPGQATMSEFLGSNDKKEK